MHFVLKQLLCPTKIYMLKSPLCQSLSQNGKVLPKKLESKKKKALEADAAECCEMKQLICYEFRLCWFECCL
jgi:hypothetical protein